MTFDKIVLVSVMTFYAAFGGFMVYLIDRDHKREQRRWREIAERVQ